MATILGAADLEHKNSTGLRPRRTSRVPEPFMGLLGRSPRLSHAWHCVELPSGAGDGGRERKQLKQISQCWTKTMISRALLFLLQTKVVLCSLVLHRNMK